MDSEDGNANTNKNANVLVMGLVTRREGDWLRVRLRSLGYQGSMFAECTDRQIDKALQDQQVGGSPADPVPE